VKGAMTCVLRKPLFSFRRSINRFFQLTAVLLSSVMGLFAGFRALALPSCWRDSVSCIMHSSVLDHCTVQYCSLLLFGVTWCLVVDCVFMMSSVGNQQ
jgi:hypothetical protein